MFTPATREFVLVTDPYTLEEAERRPLNDATSLARELAQVDPPVAIHLITPAYLATERHVGLATRYGVRVRWDETQVPPLALSRDLPRRVRERIERGAEGESRGARLLAFAEHVKADGIITTIPSLTEPRLLLLRHHRLRIVLPNEFPDFVEICGRGHLLACSASVPRWLPPNILYQVSHWKNRRLAHWFSTTGATSADGTTREHLRSAFLNRYPFILYARDMVRFFELQTDSDFRRGRQSGVFRWHLNYHLTVFYFQVWGMLDALAGIANRHLALGVSPLRCGITGDDFYDALSVKHPGLSRFVKEYRSSWITIIGDMRHPIAHAALRLQTDIVTATDESRKPDTEILEILREEDPDLFAVFPAHFMKAMEQMLIQNWRLDKMKVISDDAIYVEQADGGGYFRQPVLSIDHDLERLNAFIDAFLVGCFQGANRRDP